MKKISDYNTGYCKCLKNFYSFNKNHRFALARSDKNSYAKSLRDIISPLILYKFREKLIDKCCRRYKMYLESIVSRKCFSVEAKYKDDLEEEVWDDEED